ncbi:MAG: hypothetical protein JNK56_14225, partial [Myxococcales bacterium]|nr:hypothetical protein [Myxococcales bacterium]
MLSRHLAPSLLALVVAACTSGGAGEEDGSSSSSGGTDPTSSSGEASSSSSTGEPCPLGADGCPCTAGGACDGELACLEGNICGPGCALGSLGCSCTEGGGCDGGLVCDAAICIEGVSETCGDGTVDEFEECDDGKDNSDAGACTLACKTAVCGDGLVGPGEACDGGAGCTAGCSLSSCGNGMLDKGEECEPASADDVECTQLCTDARKVIFVTSEMYKGGEIGGVAGGDAKCQALADKAGLPGTFLSWLATSKDDAPLVRFSWKEGVPYVDTAGELLASGWQQLAKPPARTEVGGL